MDPMRLFKQKDVNALTPPSSDARDGSIRRTSFLEGDCSYWSLFRTVCHNDKCKEETQKFRQCPNSEREQAVVDPKTKQEVWKPVPEEEQDSFLSPISMPFPSFGALGSATDDLVSDVLPELDRMRAQMERDPMVRGLAEMMNLMQLRMPVGTYDLPVPFGRHMIGTADQQPQRGARGPGSRDVPIVDASDRNSRFIPRQRGKDNSDNGVRNSAMPHPRDLSEDASLTGPLASIGHSLSKWTDKITGILTGGPAHKPTQKQDANRQPAFDNDDQDQ